MPDLIGLFKDVGQHLIIDLFQGTVPQGFHHFSSFGHHEFCMDRQVGGLKKSYIDVIFRAVEITERLSLQVEKWDTPFVFQIDRGNGLLHYRLEVK
ncbi:hypothetical protein SAMN06265375_102434 [Muriicola jejuensis]|nr:hypothetical protein SAMN06265375_102434 [Muriicola jejuensis]